MKSIMNKRLELTLHHLQIMEKNCTESKKGFAPSAPVCMYLIECLLPIVDILPLRSLKKIGITTSFENSKEMLEFLDDSISRMKRTEHYALNKEEIEEIKTNISMSVFDFIIDPAFNGTGQLETFLKSLYTHLETINDILTDPRRNQAKLSYLDRTFSVTINQIASILEALSIGVANNV